MKYGVWTLAAAMAIAGCSPDNGASGDVDLSLPDDDPSSCASSASVADVREDAFRRIRAAVGADRDSVTLLDQAARVTIESPEEVADGICAGTLVIAMARPGGGDRFDEAIEYRSAGQSGRTIVQGGEAMFDRLARYNPRAPAPSPTPTPEPTPESEGDPVPVDPFLDPPVPVTVDPPGSERPPVGTTARPLPSPLEMRPPETGPEWP